MCREEFNEPNSVKTYAEKGTNLAPPQVNAGVCRTSLLAPLEDDDDDDDEWTD